MSNLRAGVLLRGVLLAASLAAACTSAAEQAPEAVLPDPLPDSAFAALVQRISEPSGYFDTDNLISNESGYLKVSGALERIGVKGGAYVGVGPDQNYSYIARIRPEIAFIVDIRRDNLLHHLLLRALMEASPTRVEFLCALTGRRPPPDPEAWERRPLAELVAFVESAPGDPVAREESRAALEVRVKGYGVPLSEQDLATIGRFHGRFQEEGLALRFNTFGRPPRPYYPTFRQLVLETDLEGVEASYLARPEDYAWVRDLQRRGRVVPVVGDLAGDHALREIGAVLREMGIPLSAVYASNVEFYLWADGTFPKWQANLLSIPASPEAVVIRSYFPNFRAPHPSSVPGYYSTQTLQPVALTGAATFGSYWDVVTRGVLELR